MIGQLYIDGIDAFVKYGIYVVKGGYNELVAYPSVKNPYTNDWQEWDGLEVERSTPLLDVKNLNIRFAVRGDWINLGEFVQRLSDGAYHNFNFVTIGRNYRLRMTDNSSIELARKLGLFSVQFADDFPMLNSTALPTHNTAMSGDYLIGGVDGVPLSNWGVTAIKGTFPSVIKSPAVKENLLRSDIPENGAIYDPTRVTFKAKDVQLNCLMRAGTIAELWQNWDSLLCALVASNVNYIYDTNTDEEYECYYKSCAVSEFKYSGKIWLQFTLTFTFTDYRLVGERIILVAENGYIINTESFALAINLKTDDTCN